ncbi:glycosyltransferase family 2 protein [Paenibacillus polymyxa]|uniref:glycosyltransferase family 2 protein n=1 Tax=Paenibacillus polymyxa TaxID=1406 RepID=UPI00237843C1|nr:glycosyltransferase [Paenibacillus polymyxa]WDM21130.1 glycosyltransferase [Paenibacillus polymyxa]
MKPTISIVIPFFNCPFIEQAVQSALNQTYSQLEIIVVDDGSTAHAERLTPYLSHIYYLGKRNGGTASALNHGIRHASGDYIAWLSSDDLFHKDKITHQIDFMLERGAYISHTNYNYIDNRGELIENNVAPSFSTTVDFLRSFLLANPINGCTIMMKRELFNHIGLFDEYLAYTHDLDMWFRVMLHGYNISFLNESLTSYRWHRGMGTIQYRPAIEKEISITQARYREPLQQLLSQK